MLIKYMLKRDMVKIIMTPNGLVIESYQRYWNLELITPTVLA